MWCCRSLSFMHIEDNNEGEILHVHEVKRLLLPISIVKKYQNSKLQRLIVPVMAVVCIVQWLQGVGDFFSLCKVRNYIQQIIFISSIFLLVQSILEQTASRPNHKTRKVDFNEFVQNSLCCDMGVIIFDLLTKGNEKQSKCSPINEISYRFQPPYLKFQNQARRA